MGSSTAMEATDQLLSSLYCAAAQQDWRAFREHGLASVGEYVGASSGVWWLRGITTEGEFTQFPRAFTYPKELQSFSLDAGEKQKLFELPESKGVGFVFVYAHREGGLTSTLLLKFRSPQKPPAPRLVITLCTHLVEAGALALAQFIGRDDWLHALGRANRGCAALVDAGGTLYAASPRFSGLLEETGLQLCEGRLPFKLPESTLGDVGGEFIAGPIHVRVARQGELHQIYARRPLPLDVLSPREQEIARSLSDGKTLKSIARQYGIAVSTVANHTTRIYRKLDIFRREELIDLMRGRVPASRIKGA